MNAITTSGLRKSYARTEALRGIDLTVPEGSVVALVGPNGAGKTTLVEILEGRRSRSAGSVAVLGLDPGNPSDCTELRHSIGVVAQHTMLELGVSASDLLLRRARHSPDAPDIEGPLDAVGLTDRRHDMVRTLSQGMRRRLDIALALVGTPRVLILDEPSAGLDPISRRHVRRLIADVNQSGATVVLTSHDLHEVQELADSVAILDEGRILTQGTVDEIIRASDARTHIEFRCPRDIDPATLPDGARFDGRIVRYETTDHDALGRELRGWSASAGIELDGLAIVPPGLDDAYLSLLGGGNTMEGYQ